MLIGHQVLITEEVSLTGCFCLSGFGPAISWESKKQNSVPLLTCRVECIAISQTCHELSFLVKVLKDFTPIIIFMITKERLHS